MSISSPGTLHPFPGTDWLRARVRATPDALALAIGEKRWSYAALDTLVDDLCAWLVGQGLPTNRRVGALLPNSLRYVCLVHACARLGLVVVPLNTRLTAAELAWQLESTSCELLLIDAPSAMTDQLAAANLFEDRRFSLRILPLPTPQSGREKRPGQGDMRLDLDTIQAIVFTSGTTGRPKAVPITFGQLFYSALGSAFRLGVRPDDLWLSVLPLYHVGGLAVIFRSCLYGTAFDLHPRFDLEAVNQAFDDKPITLASFVPTMLYRLLETRTGWPASLRLLLLGGAATTPELVTAADAQGLDLAVSYGMTEAASQIATMMPAGVRRKPGSAGRPLLFTDLKIVGENGAAAPPGAYGEIWISGPVVTAGYLEWPPASAERFVDGWFRTGDVGYLDEEGDLWLVQRRSDLIVSGGENVYPAEVEGVLRDHPAVDEICVVGLPDPEWGARVAALVALKKGKRLTAEELVAFGRKRLAGYKLPRVIRIVDALPRTASGKIARREVEEHMQRSREPGAEDQMHDAASS